MHSSSSDLCRNFVFFLYYLRAHCSWAVSTFGPSEFRVGRNHVEQLEITVVYVLWTWDWGIKKYWIIFQLSPWRRPDTLSESWVSKQSVDTSPPKNLMLKISGCGAFQNFSPFSVSRREKVSNRWVLNVDATDLPHSPFELSYPKDFMVTDEIDLVSTFCSPGLSKVK